MGLGKKTKKRTRRGPWMVPAVIAAFLFLASVASNLVAEYVKGFYEPPYRIIVWVVFGLGVIAAAYAAVMALRGPRPAQNPPAPLGPVHDSQLNIGNGVQQVQARDVSGNIAGRDAITNIYQSAPPAAPAATPHQLPPAPDDFTGRADEIRELLEKVKLGGVAICGVRGEGGVGKTVLAVKIAHELASDYPDAQIYLDLMGVSLKPVTTQEAMAHVIRSWDLMASVPEGEPALSAMYRSVLHGKRALLLLDNAADRDQVEPLLPPEGCLALVTSRQHFELPGCFTRCLDMLPPEDARKLVLKIAPRVGDRADELAKLCGYLPLALRLAAEAIASREDLSPADYLKRLSDAKAKLELIEACLSVSYDLLSSDQRERWRMLGVFPGSFDAAGAGGVWEVDGDQARDVLGELYLRSMIEIEPEGRYKLHDLSRVYADSKLTSEERSAAQRHHAEHYVGIARAAEGLYEQGGESVLTGLALFDRERANIEAGQRWAAEHWQDDDEAAKMCVSYATGAPYVLLLRLHPREWIQWLELSLKLAQHLKNRWNEAAALGNLGNAYRSLGEYRRAIELYEQWLAIAREIGNRLGEGQSLGSLGEAYYSLGEYRRAIEFHEQSLAIEHEIGNRLGEGQSLGSLGGAYYSLGEYRRAIEFCEQRLAIVREIGDRLGEGNSLGGLGLAYDSIGKYRRAIEFHEQSLAIAREIGYRLGEGNALWNMSLTLDELGERAQAIANAQAAADILEQIEAPAADRVRRKLAEWRSGS